MIRREVVYSPELRLDLLDLYDWVASRASPAAAVVYLDRVEAYLQTFDIASERGQRFDDIRPGLRVAGFERRLSVPSWSKTSGSILRVFRRGRDWAALLRDAEGDVT